MSNQSLDDSMNKKEIEEKIEKQTEILKKAFKEIDKNSDDTIDRDELTEFMLKKDKNIDPETLNKLFKTMDFDQSGSISM